MKMVVYSSESDFPPKINRVIIRDVRKLGRGTCCGADSRWEVNTIVRIMSERHENALLIFSEKRNNFEFLFFREPNLF